MKPTDMLDEQIRSQGGPAAVVARKAPPRDRRFAILDAAALLRQEMKPVNYVVPGWIPEGLLLLAAAPKVGKSTLILQISVCKAAGLPF